MVRIEWGSLADNCQGRRRAMSCSAGKDSITKCHSPCYPAHKESESDATKSTKAGSTPARLPFFQHKKG